MYSNCHFKWDTKSRSADLPLHGQFKTRTITKMMENEMLLCLLFCIPFRTLLRLLHSRLHNNWAYCHLMDSSGSTCAVVRAPSAWTQKLGSDPPDDENYADSAQTSIKYNLGFTFPPMIFSLILHRRVSDRIRNQPIWTSESLLQYSSFKAAVDFELFFFCLPRP